MVKSLLPLYAHFICDLAIAAASDSYEELLHCRQIESDQQRLACFDDALVRQNPGAGSRSRTAGAETRAAFPDVAASAPQSSREPSVAQTDVDTAVRGADSGTQPGEAPGNLAESTSIATRVVAVRTLARGEHVVTLDNGEVWKEAFASRYFPVEPGDPVTIRRQFFGGNRLVTGSGKGYRVKRVE